MTPTLPSGLYSILKVAILTFFGAFLGAVSMSTMPTSLDGWKQIVMPALGAAIAAELVFLRTTIAQALAGSALPAPAPTPAAKPDARGFARVRVLALIAGVGVALLVASCTLFSRVEPGAADCGKRILDDAAKGMTVAEIITDCATPCGADAAAVIAGLLASKEPSVTSSKAYREALRTKAAIQVSP